MIIRNTSKIYICLITILILGCQFEEREQSKSLTQILEESKGQTVDTSQYQKEAPYVIGFSNASMGNPWRAFFDAWVRYEASKFEEIDRLIRTDAQDDPVKQISDIEDLVAMNVDLLIVSATDQQALAPAIENAMIAGIPVVLVDRGVATEDFVSFVGASDSEMGRIMAQNLVDMIDESGNIVMLSGVAGSSPVELRLEAAREVFDQYPDINIVGHAYTGWQSSRAKSSMENFIQANRNIDGIWADSGLLSWPALESLEESGRDFVPATGDHLVGFSKFLEANNIPGVQVRFPATMGARAVEISMKILSGESINRYEEVELEVIRSYDLSNYDIDRPDHWWVAEYDGLPQEYLDEF